MIIWLSVELAGRAKIWGSHPQFRYWTSFFSDDHASMTNISLPLVWKTIHFRNVAVKRISALVSGGGTANHLTGSPVTNWWILEMVLCSDFFSDLYFLTCKSLERLCAMGSLYTLRLFWIRHLALFWDLKITSITKTDILWYGLHEYVCWFWCNARKPCPLTPWLSLAPDMNVRYACPMA